MKSRKKLIIAIAALFIFATIAAVAFLAIRSLNDNDSDNDQEEQIYTGLELDKNFVSYEEASPIKPDFLSIKVLEDHLGTITRIKISPEGEMMLVSDLSGTVWIFRKNNGEFVKQEEPFYKIETGFTGFPNENGLTGIAFGADFEESKDIFLLYAIDLGKEGAKNRITRISYKQDGSGNIIGTDPVNIFDSNREPAGAHQIQNGLGVMIQGKPHLLFSLGENYNPPDSKDLSKEAGKFMLIQRDGSDPLGDRPFSDQSKICVKGIRNVYGFDIDPYDPEGRVAFLDNGPNLNDRLGYAKLVDPDGEASGGYDFNWDGEDDSITKAVPDMNIESQPNSLLHIWDQTVSPDEIMFYPGKGTIPASDEKISYALVLLFGQTGTSENGKGKEILIAKIDRSSDQPTVSLSPFIRRSDKATNFAGNPLGLAYDPVTLKIYFGDLIEGRIYEVMFYNENEDLR